MSGSFAGQLDLGNWEINLGVSQQIRAEQIVNSVQGLEELRTFGWSLSSGVDVDNNQYRGEGGKGEN